MSDAGTPTGSGPSAPAPRGAGGMKWLLAASLAVNLAVAGLVIGAAMHGGFSGRGGMPRDMHFGPFSDALPAGDREALARTLFERAPDMREMHRFMRQDLDLIIAALAKEPFDPAALDSALTAQARRVTDALSLSQQALKELLLAMTPQERQAFAKRLATRWGPGQGN
ncbi:MAG: periplasmic heavy metal sensor [Paracoccaceae bacterium]